MKLLKIVTLLFSTLVLYLNNANCSESKTLSHFCQKTLPKLRKQYSDLATEIGYLYSCCAEISTRTQNSCLQTTLAIVPFVMFNLEFMLERLETARVAPTITKVPNIDVTALSRKLHKAIDGWGTDENKLINVLSSITGKQRVRLSLRYKEMYKSYLKSDIRGDTSGSFKDLLIALMYFPEEHDAWIVRDAIAPTGTKHDVLVDVIATSSVNEMLHMREAYQRFYNISVERDLAKELNGQGIYRDLILHLVNRYTNKQNITWVKDMVKRSGDASDGDLNNFVRVMRALYACGLAGRHYYFAQRIHSAVAGAGTKDSELIGLITSRTERDLRAVQESYLTLYEHSLASDLKNDLSGDYLKLMLKLL